MRSSLFILCMFMIIEGTTSQTNVDKLAATLDSLSELSFDNWKMSPDLKTPISGDPSQPGFDDSQWETLKLNKSVYQDSVWLRREITVPERYLGKSVSGTVKFLVSVDDYGYLWVNGESKGHFPWDGEFEITKNAKPGQKYLIAMKAINTGGPLRLLRAQLQTEQTSDLRSTIDDFSLSLRVGQKLLSFDTYQTNARVKVDPGIDKSHMEKQEKTELNDLLQRLATQVDTDALAVGNITRFTATLSSVRSQLKPVGEFAKRFTLFFDSNAHIDAAWLWRSKETVEVCKNTFASVINMMNARPDITYTQSAAAYYQWMQDYYPDLFKKIQQRVKDGRWEVVGGMWIEPDCNLPGGISWARQLLYAKRYFKKNLGVNVKIGWNPDSFGYNWNMPQFYQNAGIDAFITQKIGWNDTNVFPYRVFWWESPDGSRILSYFPFDYVNTVENPYRLVDWLRQFEANTGFTNMLMLFGVGDHGGGPSLEMLDRIDRLKNLDIFPTIEYGTATHYLDWLKKQDLASVPTWDDELYLEYHRGTYTTQAAMKRFNRSNEVLLTNAEKFSSLSSLYGGSYDAAGLEHAWRDVMFNQFHDILPGSSIREVYIDATEGYKEAAEVGQFEMNMALEELAQNINTSSVRAGAPVIVFNPLSWERTDIVTVALPESDTAAYAVFDPHGKEVASQALQSELLHRTITFIADHVPSLGYKTYELRRQKPTPVHSHLASTDNRIENEFFGIAFDADSGWIRSIVDKRNGKELLAGFGNELQILEDKPSAWDAWNIGLTGVKYPSTFRKVEIVESGPVRVVLRVQRDYLMPGVTKDFPTEDFPSSFFTQDIMLYDGIDQIFFKTDVDWWEDKTMLKVAFPLSFSDTVATYEIPFGHIERSTQNLTSYQKAQFEVSAERWADVSTEGYGVSLLNNSKYGYDIKGNVMRLSLLRSPKWPDPTADRGKHSIEYALYPHAGGWQQARTVRRGYAFNTPLVAITTERHKGTLPAQNSFITLTPPDLILTSIKRAEDSNAWIVQWYESGGKAQNAKLVLPRVPRTVTTTNFLEQEGDNVTFEKDTIMIPTKANSVVTLKVAF